MWRPGLSLWCLLFLIGEGAPALAVELPAIAWRRDESFPDLSAPAAVAYHAPSATLAAGDERGVVLRRGDAAPRRVRTRGSVRDLLFDAQGTLWAATDDGLWRIDAEGRLEDRSPQAGEEARRVLRVSALGESLAVATGGGVYWTVGGDRWERVDGEAESGVPTAVALAREGRMLVLWIGGEQGLVRVELAGEERVERIALPSVGEVILDVAPGLAGARAVALGERALFVQASAEAPWTTKRPAWPPGVVPARLVQGAGRLWLATDRGLLEARQLAGPWRRSAPPAGRAGIRALASEDGRLYAATEAGLLVGTAGEAGVDVASLAQVEACEPTVLAVQRRALAHLELGPERVAAWRRAVRRRGLLPVVTLQGTGANDRSVSRDHDEAFVSGDLRHLFDRDHERDRERELRVVLSWDLRELFFDPEELEVSEEARRLIQLRDDVLDEINQIYFERRRALAQRAAAAPGSEEALAARLRADELAAGLDAWTGGWFGRAARNACRETRR